METNNRQPLLDIRIIDHPDDPGLEIPDPVDVVKHRECFHVVEQPVDRKVPSPGVLLRSAIGIVPEDDSAFGTNDPLRRISGVAAVLVGTLAEGGDLDYFCSIEDVSYFESSPDDPAVAKELPQSRWRGGGGDVVILGAFSEVEIADGSTDEVGLVAMLVETPHDRAGILVDILAGDRMPGAGDDGLIRWGRRSASSGILFFCSHVLFYRRVGFLFPDIEKRMVSGGRW